MPTPVGRAPRDPNDPDHWDEWYDEDDGEAGPGFGWPIRILALLIVLGIALAYVLSI